MLSQLIAIKLAVMASALGLNTDEWSKPSPAMVEQVSALEKALKLIGDEKQSAELQKEINDSFKKIQELADKGDKDALFAMGLFLQQSKEQGALEKVLAYYKKASDAGQLQAKNNLGFIIAASTQDKDKQKEGVALIKAASDAGLNPARRNMAQIYLNGMAGETKDPAAALKLLDAAAAEKDGDAAYMLGQFYLGAGGDTYKSEDKGFSWIEKAADMGNANALDTLGNLYLNGGKVGARDIPANPKKAVDEFKSLADKNNPVGLRKMAQVYEAGIKDVEPKDFTKALEYYKKAAQGNDPAAQFRLAQMLDAGVKLDPKSDKVDVAPNPAQALQLYKLAAQGKIPLAALSAGLYYENGISVDRDLQKAFAYYMAAAQEGVPAAMQKVGDYYLNGASVVKDPVSAAAWYLRSALSGTAEGWLAYGAVTEAGAVASQQPYLEAAQAYENAYKVAAVQMKLAADAGQAATPASSAVAVSAYLRLAGLYARGVLVDKDAKETKPNLERAYALCQLALAVDPKNKTASDLVDAILTKDKGVKAKGDADVDTMKKKLEKDVDEAIAKAKNGGNAAAAAAPVAAPVATPAPTKGTPKGDAKKKGGGK